VTRDYVEEGLHQSTPCQCSDDCLLLLAKQKCTHQNAAMDLDSISGLDPLGLHRTHNRLLRLNSWRMAAALHMNLD
jgi:hypothetical protein